MSSSQISADANRYDIVWGSFNPQPWRSANPRALVSRYYIVSEDNILVSGNNLSWWQQNHPDWILYACDSSGNPTHDYAYTPGDGFADVPLNIHNPNVVQYQVQSLTNYIKANGYNAMALDEVIFQNYMEGGNPKLGVGQSVTPGEYGCGTYNADGSFNRVYTGKTDPTFIADILNWVSAARQTAKANNLDVIVNHPAGSTSDPNEQALLGMVDATLDENGFSDYGNYPRLTSFFRNTLAYMKYVQSRGVAFVDIDKFAVNGETTTVPSNEREYAIATYLMGNEGAADMFIVGNNGAGYGYGAEQYYQEYTAAIGTPCAEMYEDASNPQIYYRKFSHGLSIVNSGSSGPETATLPAHTYSDIEGRAVSGSTLTVNSADAYVLLTTGNGCQ